MAKRRRINIKFVVIGAIVLVLGMGTAYFLMKTVFKPNPQKFMALAQQDIARGDWEKAVQNISTGIKYSRKPDPGPWLQLADAMNHLMSKEGAEYAQQRRGALNQALSIDPSNKEALSLLLDYHMDYATVLEYRAAGNYEQITKFATRLLQVDPSNQRAAYCVVFATLDQWLNGTQTDPKAVADAEAKLIKLQTTDPKSTDVPVLMVRMNLHRAREARRMGNMKEARRLMTETDALVTESLARLSDSATLHQRMGAAWFELAELSTATVDRPTTEPITSILIDSSKLSPELKTAYLKRYEYASRAYAEFDTATKLAKPGNDEYADVLLFHARQLERPGGKVKVDMKREELEEELKAAHKRAEELYREVIKNAPSDRRARVYFAKFLGERGRRDEAIAILAEPVPPDPNLVGVRASMIKQLELSQLVVLCDLRLDLLDSKTERAERDTLVQQVQADYDRIVAITGEGNSKALEIKGRIQLAKGDAVSAAQTFNKALSLSSRAMDDRYDLYELQFFLARTYVMTKQTGEAKKLFRQIVAMHPGYVLARLHLAELLISEGNIKGTPPRFDDGALTQLDAAGTLMPPDNPMIARLRLMAADRAKDTKAFDAMWAKVPETDAATRFEKSRIAAGLGRNDEAIRLLELVRAEKPGSLEVLQPLVQLYMNKGDKAKAEAIVKDALEKNPDHAGLKRALEMFAMKPEDWKDKRLKDIEAVKDPFQRNMLLWDFYRATAQPEKSFAAIVEAEKLSPDNGRVMAAMFDEYIKRKDFEKAGQYLERLAKRNEDRADGQIFRIRFALAQGKLDEAHDQAVKLTKIRGEFAQAWVLLGQTLQSQNRFEEAINAYQQAQDRQTGNIDALRGLVECFLAMKPPRHGKRGDDSTGQKATDARLYLELAERLYPEEQEFKDRLLRWEVMYGDPQRAVESRMAAVKDHPESPQNWMDLGVVYLTASQPKRTDTTPSNQPPPPPTPAEEAKSKEFLAKARDTFSQALAKFPDGEPALRFMQALVETQLQLKEIDQAEKVITTFLAKPEYKALPDSTAALADFYERASRPQQAEKVLREALVATPDNVGFQIRLAGILRGQNKIDEALKVLEANSDNPRVARERVETLLKANRLEEASKFVDAQLAKDPNSEFFLRLRANVDFYMGKFENVRLAAKRILDKDPNDLDGLYLRARVTLIDPNGDVNAAISDMVRVVKLSPRSIDALIQLANAYWRRGVFDEAIRSLEAAVAINPADKTLRLQLLNYQINARPPKWFEAERFLKETRNIPQFANDVDLIHVEAQMWLVRKDPARALNLIREALKQNPENLAFLHTYFSILSDNKDYNTLLAETDKTIKSKPELWWAYQFRGIAKRRRNDAAGGLADLKAALNGALKANDHNSVETVARTIATEFGLNSARDAMAPLAEKDPHWQLVLANIMLSMGGDSASALSLAEKALSVANLQPADLEVGLKLAGVLYMNASPPNVSKAVDCYSRLLKELPNDTNVLNNLAYLLLEPGPTYNPGKAVEYSKRCLELTQAQDDTQALPLVMDTHAWALIHSGRVDDGIAILRDALTKKRFADAFYHLGDAYLRKQPPDLLEAERALEDGKLWVEDALRAKQPVDPNMRAKIQASLDRVKQMRK